MYVTLLSINQRIKPPKNTLYKQVGSKKGCNKNRYMFIAVVIQKAKKSILNLKKNNINNTMYSIPNNRHISCLSSKLSK